MERYKAIGVEWHFTELTIALPSTDVPFNTTAATNQAILYKGLLDNCLLDLTHCTCFQTWGFVDGWTVAYEDLQPYPFDESYNRKLAFNYMMSSMDPIRGT